MTMDRKANVAFYGSPSMTPEKIFASSPNIAPDIANTFVQILTAQTSRLPVVPECRRQRRTEPWIASAPSACRNEANQPTPSTTRTTSVEGG